MLFKLNAMGCLNASSMAEYSKDKSIKTYSQFTQSVLHNIRRFGNEHIYDKFWVQEIIKIMQPTEILIVRPIEDYFLLEICTQYESEQYYVQWCVVNNLIPQQYLNLKRFIKEVRCIWQEN